MKDRRTIGLNFLSHLLKTHLQIVCQKLSDGAVQRQKYGFFHSHKTYFDEFAERPGLMQIQQDFYGPRSARRNGILWVTRDRARTSRKNPFQHHRLLAEIVETEHRMYGRGRGRDFAQRFDRGFPTNNRLAFSAHRPSFWHLSRSTTDEQIRK
jgi:hypothetical protein